MKLLLILLLLFNNSISLKTTFKNFIYKKKLESNDNELFDILDIIKKTALHISKIISYSQIENLNGNNKINDINTLNIHGENQQKLDYIANNLFKNNLCSTFNVDCIISEEENEICKCYDVIENNEKKKYIVTIDPIDGSSNLNNGMPTASIFSIYKKSCDDIIKSLNKNNIISCGYVLYSSSINFVFSINNKIYHFLYDQDLKDFILIDENIKIKQYNRLYSINEGYTECFSEYIKKYLKYIKLNDFKQRYFGCIASDFHNILINGGIFLYPKTKNNNGKIRLLYEAIPLSYLIKLADGESIDGNKNILDKELKDIHEKTEIFFGSKENIKELKEFRETRKNYPDINLNIMFDV